jgi:phytanoyl-CoA hydroxylase
MPGPNTIFDTLWIDSPDAHDVLERKTANGEVDDALGQQLSDLIDKGFAVIPGAISGELADQVSAEISSVSESPKHFIARRERQAYAHPTSEVFKDPTFRLIDFHVNSKLVHKANYSEPISRLLSAAFTEPANAFQCLTFIHGSQQNMHQDGAYVVVSEPLKFLASWIALEDVQEGSGELMYYAGSHKLDDYIFGEDSKSWNPKKHGKEIHKTYLDTLTERCEKAGCKEEFFLPKKGDALIWASDLVHGGSKMKNDLTRRSIVTHYCPKSVIPNFNNFTDYFCLRQVAPEGYISSRHYDLRKEKKWWNFGSDLRKPKFMGERASKKS